MEALTIKNPGAAHAYEVAVMHRGKRANVSVEANTTTEAGLLAEQKGYAVIPAFAGRPLSYLDYSLNAYNAAPRHEIVEHGTRRVIARVHHEEDLFMLLKATKDHRVMLNALREIIANDPYQQSSAGIIARHAIAAVEATALQP